MFFEGSVRCVYVVSCWIVCPYLGRVYHIFWQFPCRGQVDLSLQLHWLLVSVVLLLFSIFFVVVFYNLGHVSYAAVADFYVVFVERFGQGALFGEVFFN